MINFVQFNILRHILELRVVIVLVVHLVALTLLKTCNDLFPQLNWVLLVNFIEHFEYVRVTVKLMFHDGVVVVIFLHAVFLPQAVLH